MNQGPRKQRISILVDSATLRHYKEFARRYDYPYQRLMQEALKYAMTGYLPTWEIPRKLLASAKNGGETQ